MFLPSQNVRKLHSLHCGTASGLGRTSAGIRFWEIKRAWSKAGESNRLIWKFLTLSCSFKESQG